MITSVLISKVKYTSTRVVYFYFNAKIIDSKFTIMQYGKNPNEPFIISKLKKAGVSITVPKD